MNHTIFAYIAIFLILHSCNPVGDDLNDQIPVSHEEISSVSDLKLKKGDEVVVWTQVKVTYEDEEETNEIEQEAGYSFEYQNGEYVYENEIIEKGHLPEDSRFSIKYLIQNNGITKKSGQYDPFEAEHYINSEQHKNDSYNLMRYDEEDSVIYYNTRAFEAESLVFTVPENGTYSFDFKLYKEKDYYKSSSFGVTLRVR